VIVTCIGFYSFFFCWYWIHSFGWSLVWSPGVLFHMLARFLLFVFGVGRMVFGDGLEGVLRVFVGDVGEGVWRLVLLDVGIDMAGVLLVGFGVVGLGLGEFVG